jgi:peroxiredoxin Q/BCP
MKEAKPIAAGTKAPLFKLLNQDGKTIELKNLLKEFDYVLIYFYPRAMTPGCTTQACELESSKKIYHRKKIKVLGISPDKPESLMKFAVKEGLTFDLLSDVDHVVADAYGVWGKKTFMGKTKEGLHRVSFLISQNGSILHTMNKVNTKTHHEDVLALIKN